MRYARSTDKRKDTLTIQESEDLHHLGIQPSCIALLVCKLAKTLASCIPPGRRIGVARVFQRGVRTVKMRVLTRLSCRPPRRVFDLKKSLKKGLFNYGQDIVMAFSPPVLGCLVKKSLQKGGHGHPRTPPGYALAANANFKKFLFCIKYCLFIIVSEK